MSSRSEVTDAAPTLDEVRTWPAMVGIPAAARVFLLSETHGYNLARRGEFPARVLKIGGRYRVVTASIIAALADDSQAA